ncbi:beta-1,4-glucuronyltransferase 1-like [Ixodes scapularis]|uniref:beta-1,4-glucuronyltransferase 1-like n=1 Tax=Ixodes scapularis TaxID=6945 RepID=UPI001A9D81C1|nr:beta-1,4-glucuronyltransferase 1-like [Ixodes scapularis]
MSRLKVSSPNNNNANIPREQNKRKVSSSLLYSPPPPTARSVSKSKFVTYANVVPADQFSKFNESVTLTTHATHDFLQHTPALCKRWRGPLSLAVYAPGPDYAVVLDKISFLRRCSEPCVRANVTWHIVSDSDDPPVKPGKTAAYVLAQWNKSCSSDVMTATFVNFRRVHKKVYPVNVLRNLARMHAKTRHLMASDIELYPSQDIIPRFLRLVQRRKDRSPVKEVYALQPFEVRADQDAPLIKRELVRMLGNGTAVFFHQKFCAACHMVPEWKQWLSYLPDDDTLDIFTTETDAKNNSLWEPIYIGTNAEPLYPEEMSWEGKRDKFTQRYEMCLMGYKFHVLDNAFLVHAPGIKQRGESGWRHHYISINYKQHNNLRREKKISKNQIDLLYGSVASLLAQL